jgi:hypothetical protein
MLIGNKYYKSQLAVILAALGVVVAGFGVGHAGSPVDTAPAVAFQAGRPTAVGVRDGRFYLAFPVRSPETALTWVTPTIRPLVGLSGLAVYVIPPTGAGSVPEPLLAGRDLDTLPPSARSTIVIAGTCSAIPPPEQQVRIVVEARIGSTITAVPVIGAPMVSARDLVAACLPGVRDGSRPQA